MRKMHIAVGLGNRIEFGEAPQLDGCVQERAGSWGGFDGTLRATSNIEIKPTQKNKKGYSAIACNPLSFVVAGTGV